MKQSQGFSENTKRQNRYAAAISAMIAFSITAGAVAATPAYADEGDDAAQVKTVQVEQKAAPETNVQKEAAAEQPSSAPQSVSEAPAAPAPAPAAESGSTSGTSASTSSAEAPPAENGGENTSSVTETPEGETGGTNCSATDSESAAGSSSNESGSEGTGTKSGTEGGGSAVETATNNSVVDESTPDSSATPTLANANTNGTLQETSPSLNNPAPAVANVVRNRTTGATYQNLSAAISNANTNDILDVSGSITEEASSFIKKNKTITIISTNGGVINFSGGKGILVYGGVLILGDGSATGKGLTLIKSNGNIQLIDVEEGGKLIVNDGATIDTTGNKSSDAITVGLYKSSKKGSPKASYEGNGGVVKGGQVNLGEYSSNSTISGGIYTNANGVCAVYVEGQVKVISGGSFTAGYDGLANLGTIDLISGGAFAADYDKEKVKVPQDSLLLAQMPAGLLNLGTIKSISGGNFTGEGNSDACGLLNGFVFLPILEAYQAYPSSIKGITGGTFTGTGYGIYNSLSKNKKGFSVKTKDAKIDSISNVTATGTTYCGLENHGTVTEISNSTFVGCCAGVHNRAEGVISKLVSGTYYGFGGSKFFPYGYGYRNESKTATKIEPDLTSGNGIGRYWGGIGFETSEALESPVRISDGKEQILYTTAIYGKVILPKGYRLTTASEHKLPSLRGKIDTYTGNNFRYLKALQSLSYNGNGGTGTVASQTETTGGESLKVAQNGFTRPGYKFTGWNTAADGTGTAYIPYISGEPTSSNSIVLVNDTVLYAQWAPYVLSYDKNAGAATGKMDNSVPAKDDATGQVTVSANAFELPGWKFAGWNTKANGAGTSYGANTKLVLTDDLKLYAQWAPYVLSYDKNAETAEGKMENSLPISKDDPAVFISDCGFSRLGYMFTGWKDVNGNSYIPGSPRLLCDDLTIYAQWEPFKLHYNKNADDATGKMTPSIPASEDDPYALIFIAENGFTRDGYKFIGWNTDPNGEGGSFMPGMDLMLSEMEMTLFAQWEKIAEDDSDDPINVVPADNDKKVVKKAKAEATPAVAAEEAIPKTGDEATPFGAAILAIASLLAGFFARFRSRKSE